MTSPNSVATILEREILPSIAEWLRRVNFLSDLKGIPLSSADRTAHLPQLYHDIASRLRLPKGAHLPVSHAATMHGKKRRDQGYSAAMLVEESRLFQTVTFRTLNLHLSELDLGQLLLDVIVIADEADLQLMQAVCGLEAQVPSVA
jgi:hypothetical protein